MRRCPVVGLRMPARARSVVVLPAPFGPMSPTISPADTWNESSSTGGTVLAAVVYVRPKFSTEMAIVLRLGVWEVIDYVATHASALKAHRQSLKNRERNRQFRARLRNALRSVRAAVDGNDLAGAKAALKDTISLIDKMAGKGVIHRNAASRYKSRLAVRLKGKAA